MGARKLADSLAYPPRAMRADQAAAYLSMSKSMFLELVSDGSMPKSVKIRGMATWDRFELDAAYEDFKEGHSDGANSVHKRLRELADAKRK